MVWVTYDTAWLSAVYTATGSGFGEAKRTAYVRQLPKGKGCGPTLSGGLCAQHALSVGLN